MRDHESVVELGEDFVPHGGDFKLVGFCDVDGSVGACKFLPSGAIHLAKKDGILAGLYSDKIAPVRIVADRGSGPAEEESGPTPFAVVVEVEGD